MSLIEVTTRKERLTFVADNAKGDKDAPSYFGGIFFLSINSSTGTWDEMFLF